MANHGETPVTLSCGLTLSNRLVKAAMAERRAVKGRPGSALTTIYTKWGEGGWGAVMTGNAMVDARYLGSPSDTVIPPASKQAADQAAELEPWKAMSACIKKNGSAALMQINHAGRQSPISAGSRSLLAKNLAPSPIPLDLGSDLITRFIMKCLYGTPAEMSEDQVQEVISLFVRAARFAHDAGFDGVEVHAAHGYLLSTFLSAKDNRRTDSWGGTAARRAAIIVQIIREIRKELGSSFCVGLKMNSADQMHDSDFEEVLEQVSLLAKEEIDFLEISGGSYEDPKMINGSGAEEPKAKSTVQREAYFLQFASEVRKRHPALHIMLTGGFRTRSAIDSALEARACDTVGIGRPSIVAPDFPRSILGIGSERQLTDEEAGLQLKKHAEPWFASYLPSKHLRRAVRGGIETVYWGAQIKNLT